VKSELITVLVASGALGVVVLLGSVGNTSNQPDPQVSADRNAPIHNLKAAPAPSPVDPRTFIPDLPFSGPSPERTVIKPKRERAKAARAWAKKKTTVSPPDPLSQFLAGGSPGSANSGNGCTAGYEPCLPDYNADYDCRNGSGNGPYYTGEVRIVGTDIHGLDADGDGWGCDGQ
jgi:hypothetical protein